MPPRATRSWSSRLVRLQEQTPLLTMTQLSWRRPPLLDTILPNAAMAMAALPLCGLGWSVDFTDAFLNHVLHRASVRLCCIRWRGNGVGSVSDASIGKPSQRIVQQKWTDFENVPKIGDKYLLVVHTAASHPYGVVVNGWRRI